MSGVPAVLLVGTVAGLVTFLFTGPVLRALPEPPEPDGKTAYRDLARPSFAGVCGLCAALAAAAPWALLPVPVRPLWLVLASVGVLLAAVDARTTWVPRQLTRAGWLGMGLATGLGVLLGGEGSLAVQAALGALVAGGLYAAAWAITRGGFGFGDVRFAPLIGAASASTSWQLLVAALTLASVAGGVHGLARLLTSKSAPFPYVPSMLVGTYAALLVFGGP